jgi:hypothetical protein
MGFQDVLLVETLDVADVDAAAVVVVGDDVVVVDSYYCFCTHHFR